MSDIPVLLWLILILLSCLLVISMLFGTIGFLIWEIFRRVTENEDKKKGP